MHTDTVNSCLYRPEYLMLMREVVFLKSTNFLRNQDEILIKRMQMLLKKMNGVERDYDAKLRRSKS